jgi:hypothetical protein
MSASLIMPCIYLVVFSRGTGRCGGRLPCHRTNLGALGTVGRARGTGAVSVVSCFNCGYRAFERSQCLVRVRRSAQPGFFRASG